MITKIFGEDAQNIEDGYLFKASVKYVEGRKVIELIPTSLEKEWKPKCPDCLHGWQRDVETENGMYLGDIECIRCNGTGFL